jgi:transposase
MVGAVERGRDLASVAVRVGRSRQTVRFWLRRYRRGGPEALADAPRSGRPPKADAAYLAAMERAVQCSPRSVGLAVDVWTSHRLSAYLAATTGVRLSAGRLRCHLHRRGFACGRAKHTLAHLQDAAEVARCKERLREVEATVAAEPGRYEVHHQDESHLETNPHLSRVWHRRGGQPTLPAAGANRRLTVFGGVEVLGRGRVEVLCGGQDSACFRQYLDALDARHAATGKEVFLVLDHAPCHRSKTSTAALAGRSAWLHAVWLPKHCPELNRKELEWRLLKRDARGHLAPDSRAFADGILEGLRRLGGERVEVVDRVPEWFLAGHRYAPTGRPTGRPRGRTDRVPRSRRWWRRPEGV